MKSTGERYCFWINHFSGKSLEMYQFLNFWSLTVVVVSTAIAYFYPYPCSTSQALRDVNMKGAEKLTSTIFSMCFLMIVGSALGFTETAHSSIILGLGSGAGAGLEFCYSWWEIRDHEINNKPGKWSKESCHTGQKSGITSVDQNENTFWKRFPA